MEDEVKETEQTETTEEFSPTPLDELFGEASSEEATPEPEVAKAEETEVEDKPVEDEVKTDDTPEEEETTEEVDWKVEAEKYRVEAEKNEKRWKDTHKDWQRQHAMLKENGLIEDDTADINAEEDARFLERERASKAIAIEQYGEEYVGKMLYDEDAPFRKLAQNDAIFYRMKNADAPVIEAIRIVKEQEFFSKYGNDVSKIPDKIRKEVETELREKITKELQSKLSKKEKLPKTLAGVNSQDVKTDDNGGFRPPSTKELFG